MAGQGPGGQQAEVPAQILRSWDAAEAQLFPLIMARPDAYQRSLSVVQLLLGWLRSSCQDIPALLAQSARGAAILADADQGRPDRPAAAGAAGPAASGALSPDAAELAAGLRLDLVAAAACAMRYRELVAAAATASRRAALRQARQEGADWAVVEESGDQARAPYLPYQRVEAHVRSGRAVIISIQPDETLARAVWRLDEASLDLASGGLAPGAAIGSYGAAGELEDALASARLRLS